MRIEGTSCCGLDELIGVSYDEPENIVLELCSVRGIENPPDDRDETPFLLFTDIVYKTQPPSESGQNLAKFIAENRLGTVAKSTIRLNPNSDNRIRCWIWSVDNTKLIKWYRKNK